MNEIDFYIKKLNSPQKEICEKLRGLIKYNFPDILEEMKWGVPTYGDGKCYFVGLKNHVNIGFCIEGLSEESLSLLHGKGKTMRHIELKSEKDTDEEIISRILGEIV